jgi:dTDP-4-amino-4,6-dideoxygalactose transaminase
MSDAAPRPAVPQASPGRDYQLHQKEIDAALRRALDSGWYILGTEVRAFEAEFAAFLGLREVVGVASGTDAVELALRALGVGLGDAVYTVSHTAVATVAAIECTGAIPVLVDIDEATYTLDPRALAKAIATDAHPGGARPAAVVVVHLYGQMAAMPAILEVARSAGLHVVEDCAQAHGARLDGRMAGTWGEVASFSFYPTKNLGALGDGGAVATNDSGVATNTRELRQYGWRERYVSAVPGTNSRLDELQAAILRAKLPQLTADNARRQAIAARYTDSLRGTGLVLPLPSPGAEHVYHQYVVRTARRKSLMNWLARREVGAAIHYPVPVHLQPAYQGRLPLPRPLPVTERICGEIVSLPIFPALTDAEADRVVEAILDWERSGPGAPPTA